MSPWRCGWCSTTSANSDLISVPRRCWRPAFLYPAACYAPLVAGCPSYPQTDLTIVTTTGPVTFHIGLNVYVFTALMFVLGIAFAFGKASVFKYISDEYPSNIGTISGVVGLAGGMGGFILPIMFGALMDITGIRSSAFMLMYGVVWVSLIWMYLTEVRRSDFMGKDAVSSASHS